jgi:uncharacterized protein YkwD
MRGNRIFRGSLAMVMALTLSLLASAAAAGAKDPRAMVETINRARAKHGAHALRYHAAPSRSARRYARHLLRTGSFGHAGRIRASDRFRHLGELLARHPGRKPRRSRTVRAWVRSPWHRPVLLGRQFRFVGVGRVHGRVHGTPRTIWVVHLGAR